ncbi:MAG: hypothetical protein IJD40_00655 [Lachnospiraceae bacterium]|nr:hypothetical protein [Lachnospiraceae bacterium]
MKQFLLMISLLIMLLIFHDTVISGTQNGLLLWYQTLVPSLLPFILVTNAMSETNAYYSIARHFQKIHPQKTYEIIAILLGNLCGYPIGGKILNDFVKNQCISNKQANRLLPLASQASPMFLLGYVYNHILHKEISLGIFLISIYLPTIIYYTCLCLFSAKDVHPIYCISTQKINIKDTFLHAVEIMVMIGLYVIIFSILLTTLLPFFQFTPAKIILSFFEITTGLPLLNSLPLTKPFQMALLCSLCSFGGLCSAFQVKGVLEYSNTDIKKYLLNKCALSTGTFLIIYIYNY